MAEAKGILGTKPGMTQIFTEEARARPGAGGGSQASPRSGPVAGTSLT